MDTLIGEHRLNEKTALASSVIVDGYRKNVESQVQQKSLAKQNRDHIEFTEIDLFTGRIRTIRRY